MIIKDKTRNFKNMSFSENQEIVLIRLIPKSLVTIFGKQFSDGVTTCQMGQHSQTGLPRVTMSVMISKSLRDVR